MITLERDQLVFRFPEVHRDAELRIEFQRTLRIPDDGKRYPLPPGLGRFPVREVDDIVSAPPVWRRHGGVILPLYQSEALWLNFVSAGYPMLVKVAAGKINAVTGEAWSEDVSPPPAQDYLVAPKQPWLDGYCTEKGVIRQFVAMPLGAGYSPEEQITGKGEFGGLQLRVSPMKAESWKRRRRRPVRIPSVEFVADVMGPCASMSPDMSLGMGGQMGQEIYEDAYGLDEWELGVRSRCFVHLANSLVWRALTGSEPPATPVTAAEYAKHGLPWFDWYDDAQALEGREVLRQTKSIREMADTKGGVPLPENDSVEPGKVVRLGPGVVREGSF